MAERNPQAPSSPAKVISDSNERQTNRQPQTTTTRTAGNSDDVEAATRTLFPSTNGNQRPVAENSLSRRDETPANDANSDRNFVENRERFLPNRNYRPGGSKRAKTARTVSKKAKSVEQRTTIKDVILLPGPKHDNIPRGATREALYANGFVTTFELQPSMTEQEIRDSLEEKFKRKLRGSKKLPKFEFARAIHSKIILAKRQDCQSCNGRLLKHITGQGPLYIRATDDISASLNIFLKKEEEISDESEMESDKDERLISESTMHDHAESFGDFIEPDVINVDESSSSNNTSGVSGIPSCSEVSLSTSMRAGPSSFTRTPEVSSASNVAMIVKRPFVSCPTCHEHFPSNDIEVHADNCAENSCSGLEQSIYANLMSNLENMPDNDPEDEEVHVPVGNEGLLQEVTEHEVTQDKLKTELMKVVRELQTKVGSQTNRFNVQRKSILADYINTRERCSWISPENRIKVVFIGEAAIDDGGPTHEFFTDVLQQLKMRLFDGDGVPIESTVALTAGRFKYAGELMAMSIAQGGPSPNFLSPIIYDVIPKGLSQTSLSVDMIQNTQLKGIATQIDSASNEQNLRTVLMQDDVLDVLAQVGYRGIPSRETLSSKESLVRSIVVKSQIEPKLGMVKQIEEGLLVYGVLETIRSNPTLFKPVFVPGEMFTITSDEFLNGLIVKYSEKQLEKITEEIVFKHFCDFVEYIHNGGTKDHDLALRHLLRFITGSYQLPPLGLPKSVSVKFVHGCIKDCKCHPTVSTCQLVINLPVHASTFEEMKELMVSAMLECFGFGNV